MNGWTIEEVVTGEYNLLFTSATVPYVSVRLVHEDGSVLSFSQREDDPKGVWCADFAASSNGMVQFSHGTADRTCRKQTAGADVAAWLNSEVGGLNYG